MIVDYTELIERMQSEIARRYLEYPETLNYPGKSFACKVDPYYYLAVYPALFTVLARWARTMKHRVEEALVRTGSLVSGPAEARSLSLKVVWETQGFGLEQRTLEICFLHSSFIDRGVMIYGDGREPPASPLRIDAAERARVDAFLAGKTGVASMAYYHA
jgi:hypothetical protein